MAVRGPAVPLRAAHALARRRYPNHVHPFEGRVGAAPGVTRRHARRGPDPMPRHVIEVMQLDAVAPVGVPGVGGPDAPAHGAGFGHLCFERPELRSRRRLGADAGVRQPHGVGVPAPARRLEPARPDALAIPHGPYAGARRVYVPLRGGCRLEVLACRQTCSNPPDVENARPCSGAAPQGSPELPTPGVSRYPSPFPGHTSG